MPPAAASSASPHSLSAVLVTVAGDVDPDVADVLAQRGLPDPGNSTLRAALSRSPSAVTRLNAPAAARVGAYLDAASIAAVWPREHRKTVRAGLMASPWFPAELADEAVAWAAEHQYLSRAHHHVLDRCSLEALVAANWSMTRSALTPVLVRRCRDVDTFQRIVVAPFASSVIAEVVGQIACGDHADEAVRRHALATLAGDPAMASVALATVGALSGSAVAALLCEVGDTLVVVNDDCGPVELEPAGAEVALAAVADPARARAATALLCLSGRTRELVERLATMGDTDVEAVLGVMSVPSLFNALMVGADGALHTRISTHVVQRFDPDRQLHVRRVASLLRDADQLVVAAARCSGERLRDLAHGLTQRTPQVRDPRLRSMIVTSGLPAMEVLDFVDPDTDPDVVVRLARELPRSFSSRTSSPVTRFLSTVPVPDAALVPLMLDASRIDFWVAGTYAANLPRVELLRSMIETTADLNRTVQAVAQGLAQRGTDDPDDPDDPDEAAAVTTAALASATVDATVTRLESSTVVSHDAAVTLLHRFVLDDATIARLLELDKSLGETVLTGTEPNPTGVARRALVTAADAHGPAHAWMISYLASPPGRGETLTATMLASGPSAVVEFLDSHHVDPDTLAAAAAQRPRLAAAYLAGHLAANVPCDATVAELCRNLDDPAARTAELVPGVAESLARFPSGRRWLARTTRLLPAAREHHELARLVFTLCADRLGRDSAVSWAALVELLDEWAGSLDELCSTAAVMAGRPATAPGTGPG